jgi:hypothetical protein
VVLKRHLPCFPDAAITTAGSLCRSDSRLVVDHFMPRTGTKSICEFDLALIVLSISP